MFKVPELPYGYDALAATISEETMRLHHDKHHQTYVDKLNNALEHFPEWQSKSIQEILRNLDAFDNDTRIIVRNNGGGHYNHSLFWQWMTPDKTEPSEKIIHALSEKYGSVDAFKNEFTDCAINIFGSGWCWLLDDASILTTPNQDSPIMHGKNPILGLDVWEHAYYLDYRNVRADYIKKWWDVVNWQKVSELYA
jgi:Fe-Mn family superoxide dismutase